MTNRVACVVPGCRRTTGRYQYPTEWLCPNHWRLVDRHLKTFRRKRWAAMSLQLAHLHALTEAAQAQLGSGGSDDAVWAAAHREANAHRRRGRFSQAIWRRMVRQAIERAAGI